MGRPSLEPRVTWQHQNHPHQGGGYGAVGYVAVPESSTGRRGPELLDMWQHWSPPQRGGGVHRCGTHGGSGALSGEVRVRSYGTCGGTKALLRWEVGSGAARHVSPPKPSRAGRLGSEQWDTWQHVVPCHAPCLGLMPVCEGTQSVGYRQ
jgi:hypothetical protein